MRDNIRGSVVAVIVFGALSTGPILRAQGDPLIGHWMLNVAKSKYQSVPAPKSEMRVYEAFGGTGKGIKATFDRVDAAGKKVTITFSAMYDGKEYKNTYHFLFIVRDGKVVEGKEYLDTALVERVFGKAEAQA